eukprot:gene25853-biopygen6031
MGQLPTQRPPEGGAGAARPCSPGWTACSPGLSRVDCMQSRVDWLQSRVDCYSPEWTAAVQGGLLQSREDCCSPGRTAAVQGGLLQSREGCCSPGRTAAVQGGLHAVQGGLLQSRVDCCSPGWTACRPGWTAAVQGGLQQSRVDCCSPGWTAAVQRGLLQSRVGGLLQSRVDCCSPKWTATRPTPVKAGASDTKGGHRPFVFATESRRGGGHDDVQNTGAWLGDWRRRLWLRSTPHTANFDFQLTVLRSEPGCRGMLPITTFWGKPNRCTADTLTWGTGTGGGRRRTRTAVGTLFYSTRQTGRKMTALRACACTCGVCVRTCWRVCTLACV